MKKFKIYSILIWVFILAGIFLRFHNLRFNTVFDWDQENSVAFSAKEIIVNHHFPLIGPKTGIGDLRLAPFYNYISAGFFALMGMNPIAGAVESAVISFVTIVISFLLIKKIFGQTTALYFTLLWSVSPLIISLDRIPWNVNLFPLASILVFSGLWNLFRQKKVLGWSLAGAGIFIGFSSHYTILFLIAAVILLVIFNRKLISREIWIFGLAAVLAILPLIIFNIRHDFILSNNLTQSSSFLIRPEQFLSRLVTVGLAESDFIGRVLIADGSAWIRQTLAILLIISLILFRNKFNINNFYRIFFLVISVYLIGFTFYSGDIPEYYFSGLLPIIVLGYSLILSHIIKPSDQSKVLLIVFSAVLLYRSFTYVNQINPQSLGAKENIVKNIKENAGNSSVKIIYDMDLGWSYGYKYLLDFYSVKVDDKEEKNTYWISFPVKRFPLNADYKSGEIALGYPETVVKIYTGKQLEFYDNLFKARIAKNWVSLQCPGIDFDRYLLTDNLSVSCNTLEKENRGILIENVPNCNIWEMTSMKRLKIESQLPIYSIDANNLFSLTGRILNDVPVLSFERSRCIGFMDLSAVTSTESSILRELFLTIKK